MKNWYKQKFQKIIIIDNIDEFCKNISLID
jgi:hypothetical protein